MNIQQNASSGKHKTLLNEINKWGYFLLKAPIVDGVFIPSAENLIQLDIENALYEELCRIFPSRKLEANFNISKFKVERHK